MEGLQGSWSETELLVEGPDYRHVVVNAACRREVLGEVCDDEAHSGSIWLNEAEMVVVKELDESLYLSGVVPGYAWVERVRGQMLSNLL